MSRGVPQPTHDLDVATISAGRSRRSDGLGGRLEEGDELLGHGVERPGEVVFRHHRDDDARTGRSQKLSDEGGGEPVLILLIRPAAVDDEEPVDLRRHEGVDDVHRVTFLQAFPE